MRRALASLGLIVALVVGPAGGGVAQQAAGGADAAAVAGEDLARPITDLASEISGASDAAPVAQPDAAATAEGTDDTTGSAAPEAGPAPLPEVPLPAPDATGIDYAAWEKLALRAEDALEAGRASSAAFDALRRELASWRARFDQAQHINQNRIDTVQSQIDALGPAPAEGEPAESATIATRRAALQAQLAELSAPRRTATEAYTRADSLIGRIDALLRERQAHQFLQLGPSPLNPVQWPVALAALTRTVNAVTAEVRNASNSAALQAEFRENLPAVLFYIAIAALFLIPGRNWVERKGDQLKARARGLGTGVASFFASLGQLMVPVAGSLALAAALNATSMLNLRSQIVVDGLVTISLAFFIARWIALRIFPKVEGEHAALVPVSQGFRAEARVYAGLLGVLVGLLTMLTQMSALENYSDATRAIFGFPITALGGLLLARLGQILLRGGRILAVNDEANTRLADTILIGIGRLTIAVGIVAPSIAAIGYQSAAEGVLWPAVSTLGLLGLLVILSRLFSELYAILTQKDEEALTRSLLPVVVTFFLVIAALPVLALIWGMRVADLAETWARIKSGITIGDVTVSPANFLTFVIVFAVGYVLTRLVQQALATTVLPKTRMDIGGQNAVRVGVGYIGIFIAALAAITTAGIDLSSLAIVAGALSVGIGFGLQTIVSNFVSGIILLIERPISEGDWIQVGDQMGFVRDISVRATRIETFDRTDVIVPNADLISGQVTNYTRGNSIGRLIVPVGVAYGTDTRKVERILHDIAMAHPMIAVNPEPQVLFVGLGASSLDFEMRVILPDVRMIVNIRNDLLHEIVARFTENGIEIPFAQTDIWFRNPESLRSAASTPAAEPPASPPEPPVATRPAPDAPPTDDAEGDGQP